MTAILTNVIITGINPLCGHVLLWSLCALCVNIVRKLGFP